MHQVVEQLIDFAVFNELINERDVTYCRNCVYALLQLDFEQMADGTTRDAKHQKTMPQLLDLLVADGQRRGVIQTDDASSDCLRSKIMDIFLPHPSHINATFLALYKKDKTKATDYFYTLSKNSDYIQTEQIAKNIAYQQQTAYGELDITINLSKPEKDPKQIAFERENKKKATYPACFLCLENEGYPGHIGHPARSNHRVIDVTLTNEPWYFQYSPYMYYNEHSIVFSKAHRPMTITKETFGRLLDFVFQFPHYFIGSNADLPIVGGSILSHDHYQAGRYTFAMTTAKAQVTFSLPQFDGLGCAVLHWPLSVIRLTHTDRSVLTQAADYVFKTWVNYSDEAVNILSHTFDTPHNTVTPIARFNNGVYELDLALRNNRTTEACPFGLFHAKEASHHIKKENIGLIEVMGLAVLPARLLTELTDVKKYLLDEGTPLEKHLPWADAIKTSYDVNEKNVDDILNKALADKYMTILEDCGVFKQNKDGHKALMRFIDTLKKEANRCLS